MIRRSELLILQIGAIDRVRDPGLAPGFLLLHPGCAMKLEHESQHLSYCQSAATWLLVPEFLTNWRDKKERRHAICAN
jgi:hypothetical protein